MELRKDNPLKNREYQRRVEEYLARVQEEEEDRVLDQIDRAASRTNFDITVDNHFTPAQAELLRVMRDIGPAEQDEYAEALGCSTRNVQYLLARIRENAQGAEALKQVLRGRERSD